MEMRTALVLALAVGVLLARRPAFATDSAGTLHFVAVANSSFDVYTQNPTQAQKDWMRAHYWRMLTYSPYFDTRLAWFPDAWVYKDLYAIYTNSTLATAHPEWILRDASGNKLYIPYGCSGGTCPQYAADVGSPGFRANWIQEATATLGNGYRGLFVDDVNMLISRVGNGSGSPVAPIDPRTNATMTETDWRRYMAEFVEQIRSAFASKEIVHNVLWFAGVSDPSVQRELLAANTICLERGVNDSGIVAGTGQYGFDTFFSQIDWLHTQGRAVFLLPGVSTSAAREYGVAAYFLVSAGSDAMGNDPGGGTSPSDWWAGYGTSLGAAHGNRYLWNGLLRRDFDGGMVLLNRPGSGQQTVALGGSYLNLAGQQVSSVTLGAAQGAVLRGTTSTPPPTAPHAIDVVPTH
jgi:putative glycosyl hydrolase-like family 15 (GHL15) protein